MTALTASQAPGFGLVSTSPPEVAPPPGPPISGGSPYRTELPPLVTPDEPGSSSDLPSSGTGSIGSNAGIPASVLAAYKQAADTLATSQPGCHLRWELLAAIGQVESGQARGGDVDASGTTTSPILGPVLNGVGFANISDTDHGAYDGDATHDRAVGPMQFIPSTWATWGSDGNGDGKNDPNNVFDAALAAGRYLCASGRDLSNAYDLDRAILGYNHSQAYLRTVKSWFEYFKSGHHAVPDNPGAPGSSPSSSPSSSGSDKGKNKDKDKGGDKGNGGGKGNSSSPTPTASASGTVGPTKTPKPSPTHGEGSTSPSPDPTETCPSPSPSPSDSDSASPSPSDSESPSPSPSDDPCASPSPSSSGDNAPSAGTIPSPKP